MEVFKQYLCFLYFCGGWGEGYAFQEVLLWPQNNSCDPLGGPKDRILWNLLVQGLHRLLQLILVTSRASSDVQETKWDLA